MKPRTVYRPDMRISELTQGYITSVEHDEVIAREVAEVAALHVALLLESRLLGEGTACRLLEALLGLAHNPKPLLERLPGYEDIHEALEALLEELAGREAARSFPLARSRNDHVSAALRLWGLRRLTEIHCEGVRLAEALLAKAEEYADTPFPLHTHFQPAQVGTAGHWLHSYAEAVLDALRLLEAAALVTAKSPLGSGPAAGTSLPVKREASPLPPVLNTLYATGSRLFANAAIAAVAVLMTELSRLAADIVLYSHPSIAAVRVPEEHVSTSSAMPHKKNPVTAEVLRARAARVAGLLAAALGVNHGLPSGYNLDLQEENPLYYQALLDTLESLRVLRDLMERLEVDEGAVERMLGAGAVLTSLEAAERLAVEEGLPFRDAYLEVARSVRGTGAERTVKLPSPREVVELRVSLGAAGPGLRRAIEEARRLLGEARSACERLRALSSSTRKWLEEVMARHCR